MKYKLRIELAGYEIGTVIKFDGQTYTFPDGNYIDHRGSIYDGELAMLLDSMIAKKLTNLLEPME